jgi:CRP-like cAMP-binding protein
MLLRTRTELYSEGTYVARAGERADRLIVVVSGRINISPPGQRYFVGRITPG